MKLHVPIRLRWADLDAYGHVNNTDMLRILEEARIEAFWASDDESAGTMAVLDGRPGASTLTLIARQEIEYLAPVPYLRRPLDVAMWLSRMGGASLDICYEVRSPVRETPRDGEEQTLFARARTTLVLVDAHSQRPRRISDVERAAWEPYMDEPVDFSRR